MILVPLSDHPFYLWQAVVQMYALQGQEARWLIYNHRNYVPLLVEAIIKEDIGEVVVYPDWERDRSYNAAMKPWLVGKWLTDTEWDGDVQVFDPDVIPTGLPLPSAESEVLFGTCTDWYTGPEWLDSKGVLTLLCDLLGVDIDLARQFPGIGAQYIFKDIPGYWWEIVAKESIKAYHLLKTHPVDAQPWCAEMYVTHLLALRDWYKPVAHPQMDMIWANNPVSGWNSAGYFHDAGVLKPQNGSFHKNSYQSWPRRIPEVASDQAAYRYVELIKETEAKWPKLIKKFSRH